MFQIFGLIDNILADPSPVDSALVVTEIKTLIMEADSKTAHQFAFDRYKHRGKCAKVFINYTQTRTLGCALLLRWIVNSGF